MKYIFLIIAAFTLIPGCNENKQQIIKVSGKAQGTTYQITYLAENNSDYKQAIDSILRTIDSSLSTYAPASIISRINKNDSSVFVDTYFTDVFNKAIEVSKKNEWPL